MSELVQEDLMNNCAIAAADNDVDLIGQDIFQVRIFPKRELLTYFCQNEFLGRVKSKKSTMLCHL